LDDFGRSTMLYNKSGMVKGSMEICTSIQLYSKCLTFIHESEGRSPSLFNNLLYLHPVLSGNADAKRGESDVNQGEVTSSGNTSTY